MKKRVKSMIVAGVCAVCIAACAFAGCFNVDFASIYDNDKKISSSVNSYSSVARMKNVYDNGGGVICGSFSGVDTVYKSFTVSEGMTAEINIEYRGDDGKIKFVLTDGEAVYTLKEAGWMQVGVYLVQPDGAVDFAGIPQGTYALKMVGVKADFKATFKFEV